MLGTILWRIGVTAVVWFVLDAILGVANAPQWLRTVILGLAVLTVLGAVLHAFEVLRSHRVSDSEVDVFEQATDRRQRLGGATGAPEALRWAATQMYAAAQAMSADSGDRSLRERFLASVTTLTWAADDANADDVQRQIKEMLDHWELGGEERGRRIEAVMRSVIAATTASDPQ
jgi:hypothetical protein